MVLTTCGETNYEANPPNVLFLAVDDLNNLIGRLEGVNYGVKTPNLDRLAAKGVLFSNAHCQAPLCGPSRASIMTGLRPSTTGIYGMIPDDKIRSGDNQATKDIILLPEYFRDHGYHTMGIGKLFHKHAPAGAFHESGGRVKGFGPLPPERFVWDGFGTSDRKKYGRTSTDWGAFPEVDSLMPDHQSVNWAIERLNRTYEQPFFLGVGFLRVHVPLYVPQKWFDLYPLDSIKTMPYRADDLKDVPPVALQINDLPMMPTTDWAIENGEWPKILQAYLACVSFVDYEIGRLLDELEASQHADNTVIVLWSDHGYRLGEKGTFAKHALWESATKAPLLFIAPDLPKGLVIDQPAEMLSIYPTLTELCGLPAYDRNEGRSLVSLMRGDEGKDEQLAITTFGMNNHTVRSERFRYIQYEDGGEELYDHTEDPHEFTNQADNPRYQKEKASLKKQLPGENAQWAPHSSYSFQPYFVEQKARTSPANTETKGERSVERFTNRDLETMTALRAKIRSGYAPYQKAYQKMLLEANTLLKRPLLSVMRKKITPPSGNKHDYLSLAPYWWPDPEKADGLPWIRKDGEVNPATKDANTDNKAKSQTFKVIEDLALAAWISGNKQYGQRAVEHINTWFLDPATKMNPNFNYAQGIPGRNDGRCFGIIEFIAIQDVIDALEMLDHVGMLPEATKTGMHEWLAAMLHWFQTSELGIEEGLRHNNHATWYDVQVVCMLRYLGRPDAARKVLETAKTKIIAAQLEPDGSQPHELERTKSISYSTMNLNGMTQLAWHGRQLGVDLWGYKTDDGRSIPAAYAFLKPFAFDKKPWPYPQLGEQKHYWDKARALFYQTGARLEVPEFCALRQDGSTTATDLSQLFFQCSAK
ncbi:alginate lyase family protein [Neolewinella agarilytica]|nr:alginate lyase family protein [Neolewinella agarilytica]